MVEVVALFDHLSEPAHPLALSVTLVLASISVDGLALIMGAVNVQGLITLNIFVYD